MFFDFIKCVYVVGKDIVKRMYNLIGFVVYYNVDIWVDIVL